jgi:hypothetical protein
MNLGLSQYSRGKDEYRSIQYTSEYSFFMLFIFEYVVRFSRQAWLGVSDSTTATDLYYLLVTMIA